MSLAVLPALGIAAVALSSCAGVTPAAMTINGQEVSKDDIRNEAQLRATARKLVVKQGKFDATLINEVMNDRLIREVFNQEAAARKVKSTTIGTELSQQIDARLDNDFGGADAVKALPGDYRKTLREGLATQRNLYEFFVKSNGTPEQYYAAHKSEFGPSCISHLLVPTLDAATKARARIEGGEPFGVVASAVSIDEGSKPRGGDLGCNDVAGFVAPFASAARQLGINELSQPVQTEFGFHILKVTKREAGAFDKATVEQRIQALANDSMIAALAKTKLKVHPAFGTVVPSPNGFPQIVAPGTPKPSDAPIAP